MLLFCVYTVSPRGGVVAHMLTEDLAINLDSDQNMFSTRQEAVLWLPFGPNLIKKFMMWVNRHSFWYLYEQLQ